MRPSPTFADRYDAGRRLATELSSYGGRSDVVVLALPRGGVPVAAEVAKALGAPLEVFVVRKLGVPGQEELALGAIASGGARVLNEDVVAASGIGTEELTRITERAQDRVEAQEHAYRGGRPPLEVAGRVAIVVDDGLATGATMRAALAALRELGAERIVVAVPTAPREICQALRMIADEVVCVSAPHPFRAVGIWYADFTPVEDEQVRELLGA
jgi:putative phosphoribosyl transferase